MTFDNLFSRADEETLQQLVGKDALHLMMTMDSKLASPSKLREVVVGLHTREGLLLASDKRALLLDLLSLNSSKDLAQLLGAPPDKNSYDFLKKLRINRGSSEEEILFNYFELNPPSVIDYEELPESSESMIYIAMIHLMLKRLYPT